jgi:hypothetical protein
MVAKRVLLGTLITWFLFTLEGIIHYSIGAKELTFPPLYEFLWILLTVFAFSFLSSLITNIVISIFFPPPVKGKIVKQIEKKIENKT